MNAYKFLPFAVSLVLLCGAPTPTIALDWSGWTLAGHGVIETPFWDPSQAQVYQGTDNAKTALIKNLAKDDRIMEITLDGQGNVDTLTIHKVFSYSPRDFKYYQQKVPNYAVEQEQVGRWINSLVKADPHNRNLTSNADKFFQRLERVAKNEPWLQGLQRDLLAIRLGIGADVLEQHPDFEQFAKANYLHKHMAYHHHQINVLPDGTPELLVDGVLTPWPEIKERLDLDKHGKMNNYFYTYQGLVPGQSHTVLKPFKKVDPGQYDHQYILEVVSISGFPPHNWLRLIDSSGDLYSIGFWGQTPLTDLITAAKHLVPEKGKATSPDLLEIAGDPDKMVVTPIKISQQQFEEAIAYLEAYQKDPGYYQILSVGGENCATFVRNLTDRLGMKVTSSSWLRPFNNPYDLMAWQHSVQKWREKELKKLSAPTEEERLDVQYGLP